MTVPPPSSRPSIDWINLLFIVGAHAIAVVAVLYLILVRCSGWTFGFGLLWSALCGVAITAGYHRLFSHASYRASCLLRGLYLALGAAAVQNSVLRWAADHRAHHADTDGDQDPYSVTKGFWWAHIGWVVHRSARRSAHSSLVTDLAKDPLVRFQHRFYVPLALLFGLFVPMAIGAAWGDAIGAGLVAGWLRVVALWHVTFSINSFCHTIGRRSYNAASSARNSGLVALFTLGEGYHSFHHRFQIDYRNGIRWYHFDPTKWWVWTMAALGLADSLRRVPQARIALARARARSQLQGGTGAKSR